jgi:hypothetical protein
MQAGASELYKDCFLSVLTVQTEDITDFLNKFNRHFSGTIAYEKYVKNFAQAAKDTHKIVLFKKLASLIQAIQKLDSFMSEKLNFKAALTDPSYKQTRLETAIQKCIIILDAQLVNGFSEYARVKYGSAYQHALNVEALISSL